MVIPITIEFLLLVLLWNLVFPPLPTELKFPICIRLSPLIVNHPSSAIRVQNQKIMTHPILPILFRSGH